MSMSLNPTKVRELIAEAMATGEPLTLDCIRRTPPSRPGGPGVGDKHSITIGRPPAAALNFKTAPGTFNAQDKRNKLKRVWSTSAIGPKTHASKPGWRCVTIEEVTFVHFKTHTYQVTES